MDWKEFCTLLAGIMPETPLGQIVTIRSENRPDMIKNFTDEQKRIHEAWKSREIDRYNKSMSEDDKDDKMKELQDIFAQAFG